MEHFVEILRNLKIHGSEFIFSSDKAYQSEDQMSSTSNSSSSTRYELRSLCDGDCCPEGLIVPHRHRKPKRKLSESSLAETNSESHYTSVKRLKRTTIELFEGDNNADDLPVVKRRSRRSASTSSSGSSHHHHHCITSLAATSSTVDHNHNHNQVKHQKQSQQQQQQKRPPPTKQIKKSAGATPTSDGSYPSTVQISGGDQDNREESPSLDGLIRQRYQAYQTLSQEERDQSKTDYTYAHSFSYSPTSVPSGERYNWTVPNMSRASVRASPSMAINSATTRSSTYHRSAFLEQESVSRTVVNNLPVSEIKPPTTRSRKTATNQNNSVYHSTPINTKKKFISTRLEYSDDEEDQLNQTVVRNTSAKVGVKVTDDEVAGFSEEEDEEEMTIIRKVTTVVRRTFRNIFYPMDQPAAMNGGVSNHHGGGVIGSNSVYLKSRVINRPSGDKIGSRSSLLWLMPLVLLAVAVPFWYLSNNYQVANLLEDVSQSSSLGSFGWNFPYDSWFTTFRQSGQGGGGPELSRLTFELNSLRSEIEVMKQKYAKQPEPSRPPSQPDVNLDEIKAQLALLESCCKKNFTATLEQELKHLFEQHTEHLQERFDGQMQREMQKQQAYLINYVRDHISSNGEHDPKTTAVNSAYIEQLIKTALAKYDADKTGQADFALESSGAWIVSTRCSETYELSSATYKIFGIQIWRAQNTPRVVIQSGVVPGECWCFRGAQGRLAIRLSARIIPTAFSYEHIPVSLSRDGHILSAPADISVYGLKVENDPEPSLLGQYRYSIDDNSDPLQRFEVQNTDTAKFTFRYIEIVVNSNHGHPEYTCLYRFRVHGTPVPEPTN